MPGDVADAQSSIPSPGRDIGWGSTLAKPNPINVFKLVSLLTSHLYLSLPLSDWLLPLTSHFFPSLYIATSEKTHIDPCLLFCRNLDQIPSICQRRFWLALIVLFWGRLAQRHGIFLCYHKREVPPRNVSKVEKEERRGGEHEGNQG